MAEMQLNFNKRKPSYNDEYSKMQYARRHCGFPGAQPFKTRFKTAESYADNLKKFLGDPRECKY